MRKPQCLRIGAFLLGAWKSVLRNTR